MKGGDDDTDKEYLRDGFSTEPDQTWNGHNARPSLPQHCRSSALLMLRMVLNDQSKHLMTSEIAIVQRGHLRDPALQDCPPLLLFCCSQTLSHSPKLTNLGLRRFK